MYSAQRNKITEVSPTMRVSIGDIFAPFLTLVRVGNEYFFCSHEKGFPPVPSKMLGNLSGVLHNKNCSYVAISQGMFNIILEAIQCNESSGGYHINPHSFLVGYCQAKGLDLYKKGLLKK